MFSESRFRRAASFGALFLAAALGACTSGPVSTDAPARLALTFRAAPRAAAEPVLGPVDTIRVSLLDRRGRNAVPDVVLPIARSQETFEAGFEVVGPGPFQVVAAATGSRPIAGLPSQTTTARGTLYLATARDIVPGPVEPTEVALEFTPFVTEIVAVEHDNDGETYRLRWRRVPGAVAWIVTRSFPGLPSAGFTVLDTTFTDTVRPAIYQVRAVDPTGRGGAPSDAVVLTQVREFPAGQGLR